MSSRAMQKKEESVLGLVWRSLDTAWGGGGSACLDGGLRLGEVELVGTALVGLLLDELRVEGQALWQEDAALVGEVDEVHEARERHDHDAEADEAGVHLVVRADDELAADERAGVAAGSDHAGD